MISNLALAVLLAGLWVGCLGAVPCESVFDIAKTLQEQILPDWFNVTPEKLRAYLRSDLETVANGSGPLLRFGGDTCEATFGFRGDRLESVTVIARGPKLAVVEGGRALAAAVGLPLTAENVSHLSDGETVDLSERLPADPRVPGVIKMLSLELSTEHSWALRTRFRYSRDP